MRKGQSLRRMPGQSAIRDIRSMSELWAGQTPLSSVDPLQKDLFLPTALCFSLNAGNVQ